MNKELSDQKIESQIESILFTAGRPVTAKEIAVLFKKPVSEIELTLKSLRESYRKRGIRIIEKGGKYTVISAPENAELVSKFLNSELKNEISATVLETLAIILYRQPITKAEIEEIKGSDCAYAIRILNIRGLIEEKGRKETLGRPILYGTTIKLLSFFGVESVDELPKIEDLRNSSQQLNLIKNETE